METTITTTLGVSKSSKSVSLKGRNNDLAWQNENKTLEETRFLDEFKNPDLFFIVFEIFSHLSEDFWRLTPSSEAN